MIDDTHSDATADATPLSAPPVPEGALSPFSPSGATNAPADIHSPSAAPAPEGVPTSPSGASDRIDAISAALAKAQGQIANPAKGAVNPHFRSQYSDLASGLNAIRAALSANGIAVVQQTRMFDDMLMLYTTLAHASGQWIKSEWPVVKLPAPPQVIGSALTYARRYCLFALVGIAGEGDDDDGNAASAKGVNASLIDADQLVQMQDLLADTKTSNLEAFFLATGATGFSDMTVPQWKVGMEKLREKQRRAFAKTLQP